jgi:streptomycin 6-kinase
MALPTPIALQRLAAREPAAAAWLRELPQIVSGCARDWSLTLGMPYEDAQVSWVAPVTRPGGQKAVLKVSWPHPEAEHEGDALAFWDGAGAARLLDQDRGRCALLIERCSPGRQLWEVGDDEQALAIAATVFDALWRPPPAPDAGPFRSLATEAARWARVLPERWERFAHPWSRALLDEAVVLCAELTSAPPAPVLCHQDAHGANMLQRGDEWVVIDPKPLIGDREFDLASSLRDRRDWLLVQPAAERIVRRRLDQYVDALGVDRARARGWGIVHALAWGADGTGVDDELIACAQLLAAV